MNSGNIHMNLDKMDKSVNWNLHNISIHESQENRNKATNLIRFNRECDLNEIDEIVWREKNENDPRISISHSNLNLSWSEIPNSDLALMNHT
jgi:hypothetical protein